MCSFGAVFQSIYHDCCQKISWMMLPWYRESAGRGLAACGARTVRGPCQKDALSELRKFVSWSKNTSTSRPRGGGKACGWVEATVEGCARWVIFYEMDERQHLPDPILPCE